MNDLRGHPRLTDRRLGDALDGFEGRAVVATPAMVDEPALVPACDLLLVPLDPPGGATGTLRLVRQVARRQPAPRIVVLGGEGDHPVEALLAGADAWVDAEAAVSTITAALTGKVPSAPRRWWCRNR